MIKKDSSFLLNLAYVAKVIKSFIDIIPLSTLIFFLYHTLERNPFNSVPTDEVKSPSFFSHVDFYPARNVDVIERRRGS